MTGSDIDATVLYLDEIGIKPVVDEEFKVSVAWDVPLLGGYAHKFLKNISPNIYGGFFSRINPGLLRELSRARYDCVLIQGYDNISCWVAAITARLRGIRVIWRGEATLRRGEDRKSLRSRLKRLVLTGYFGLCDAVLYSCTGNRIYLRHYGVPDQKLFPIPCAVDNDFFRAERDRHRSDKASIKKELGIEGGDLVVLFSARFTDRKRPMDLLRAVNEIDKAGITLLFVGDGVQRETMMRYAESNKINSVFVGFQNQSAISRYYSIADIAVVISEYDPSPKAMNEAMCFELPIIATDVLGTAPDLVRHGENGFVCKVGDIAAVARYIARLDQDRKLVKTLGRQSYEIVKDWNFSRDVVWLEKAMDHVLEQ